MLSHYLHTNGPLLVGQPSIIICHDLEFHLFVSQTVRLGHGKLPYPNRDSVKVQKNQMCYFKFIFPDDVYFYAFCAVLWTKSLLEERTLDSVKID